MLDQRCFMDKSESVKLSHFVIAGGVKSVRVFPKLRWVRHMHVHGCSQRTRQAPGMRHACLDEHHGLREGSFGLPTIGNPFHRLRWPRRRRENSRVCKAPDAAQLVKVKLACRQAEFTAVHRPSHFKTFSTLRTFSRKPAHTRVPHNHPTYQSKTSSKVALLSRFRSKVEKAMSVSSLVRFAPSPTTTEWNSSAST